MIYLKERKQIIWSVLEVMKSKILKYENNYRVSLCSGTRPVRLVNGAGGPEGVGARKQILVLRCYDP